MILDHRPSFVTFEKGLYYPFEHMPEGSCARPVRPMGVFLGPCGFLLAFSLGSVAVLRKLSVKRDWSESSGWTKSISEMHECIRISRRAFTVHFLRFFSRTSRFVPLSQSE
jgi:hypothetical protein